MTRRVRDDRGAAMVEFAIVLPLLLMLSVGIIQFGLAFHTQISLQAAAREGARELALGNPANPADPDEVDERVRDAARPIAIDSISQDKCDAGDETASVTVTENFTFGIPFVPLGTWTLNAKGVMRCGL